MNILHLIDAMTVAVGGPPVVCAGLAGAQARLGHQVAIATLAHPGSPRVPTSVPVHEFPTAPGRYGHSPELAAWLDQHVPATTVLHLHGVWNFATFAGARAAWRHRRPYVVVPHGMLDNYSLRQRSYWVKRAYWLCRGRRIFRRAAALHCLNLSEIHNAVSWVADLPKFVLANGVEASVFDTLPPRGAFRAARDLGQRPLAIFMSRLHPKKGLDRFLPHWPRVLARCPDARLILAGTGDDAYLDQLDALIARENLASSVLRVGQLTGPAKWQALVDADIFVLPSHQEGFSMAITEAMAAGCPPVITTECNFPQVAEVGAGRVIADGNMPAFADALADLLLDAPVRQAMADRGRTLVRQRFTWERIAADSVALYDWILAGKSLSPDGADTWRSVPPASVSA